MSSSFSAEGRPPGVPDPGAPITSLLAETLIRNNSNPILAFDLNCRLTLWNPAIERLLGISSGEALGKHVFDVLPFLKETGEDKYLHAALSGEAVATGGRYTLKPGDARYLEASYFPWRDREGNIAGALGFIRDASSEIRIRQDLEESEARFRLLFEEAPIAYHEIDSEGIVRRVNRAECRLLGFETSEIVGRHASEFVAVEERDVSRDAVRRKISGSLPPAPFWREFVCRDGKRLTLEIHETLIHGRHGRVTGIRSALLDITERKRAESALRNAHDELERRVAERTAELALANEALQGEIAERRRAEQRLSLQYAAVRILSEADSVDHATRSLVREIRECLDCEFGSLAIVDRQRDILRFEYLRGRQADSDALRGRQATRGTGLAGHVWKTGEPVWVPDLSGEPDVLFQEFALTEGIHAGLAFPILLGAEVYGAMSFCVCQVLSPDRELLKTLALIGRQIGHFIERHLLEDQLRQSQKMEAIGRLAGGVAHDFNNLLTVINGYGRMVLEELSPGDPKQVGVEEILNASDRAATLTSQLLAFSRRQMFQPKLLELNHVISNTEKMLRRVIGEHIELRTELSPNIGFIRADAGQMEQVLMNIAVNARDAMPLGGRLTIATSALKRMDGAGPEPGEAPYVCLTISDTGVGMNENTRAHLFEPFFTTKERGKGTGLGLSTVYGIVKQHGGDIQVESESGRGAKFRIFLPVCEVVGDTDTAGPAVHGPAGGSETILLVEDEAGVRNLTREILKRNGYRVLEAADGYEAIRLVRDRNEPVHLLLTDVIMPRMSGRELAEQLMSLRKGLRVLYMSGYTDDVIAYCGDLGPDADFMQKPFAPRTLARKVREALDARKRNASTAS